MSTDASWKVAVDTAHRFQNEATTFEGYQGYFEHRVSRLIPSGWTAVEFDDARWPAATVLSNSGNIFRLAARASPRIVRIHWA